MNKLDDKVIIRKSHLAALCAMLNPLNQEQDRVANEAMRLLDQDLTGWAAVVVETNDDMKVATCRRNSEGYMLPLTYSEAYTAMLEASPPLPQKEGE